MLICVMKNVISPFELRINISPAVLVRLYTERNTFCLMKDLPILHQLESSYLFEFNFVIFDYNYLYNNFRKYMCLHEIRSKWPLKHALMCNSLT